MKADENDIAARTIAMDRAMIRLLAGLGMAIRHGSGNVALERARELSELLPRFIDLYVENWVDLSGN